MAGLENYASPILRAAVFRRLFPGAHISYTIVPMSEAFPDGHRQYEGDATEAVRCEIVLADGTYVVAHKEIDRTEGRRTRSQTPEELAKDETKALGRALRDLGIPQRLTELKMLMQWIAQMDGRPAGLVPASPPVAYAADFADYADRVRAEAAADDPDGDDPDAGSEPTREQVAAERVTRLNGADKAAVAKHARDVLHIANVMRAGDKADELIAYIDSHAWLHDEPEEEF